MAADPSPGAQVTDVAELLAPDAHVERVATGATWAEGPAWVAATSSVRFSDIPGDRVLEWSEPRQELTVHATGVGFPNGRTVGLRGEVVQCSHGHRRVEVEEEGVVTPLVGSWRGARLNSPNDVVVRSDGTVWFTDPSYGISRPDEGHPGETEYGDHHVFRLDPATGALEPVVLDVRMPNGLAFSPDEGVLYVSDSSSSPPVPGDPPGTGHAVRAYDVVDGRLCKDGRVLADVGPGTPDGLRVDSLGHLWVASGEAVHVLRPDGSTLGRVEVGEVASNVCFGGDDGRTLYVTASTSLYRVRTLVTDAAVRHRPDAGA